ncbi:uncharacterized protein LOC111390394 [Olea europaea var. sylvestris]|uniref:uncharacterized protein LOC111390394 n=1 Tax=Olea europaea var. sylvestris TaxID=158386 RepID=UPI000C1D1164|nr:uncharacterized protein LOC111390394 [Olea europaea var. sylvestris]
MALNSHQGCGLIDLLRDNIVERERLKKQMIVEFEVKDLGQMRYFLVMEVAKSKRVSMFHNETTFMISYQKWRLVGKLIYLSHTRPDIAFALSVVSQHMHSPKETHMEAVYKILKYLKSSLGKGLFFKKNESNRVEVFIDADWASFAEDRRSTTGYCNYQENTHNTIFTHLSGDSAIIDYPKRGRHRRQDGTQQLLLLALAASIAGSSRPTATSACCASQMLPPLDLLSCSPLGYEKWDVIQSIQPVRMFFVSMDVIHSISRKEIPLGMQPA